MAAIAAIRTARNGGLVPAEGRGPRAALAGGHFELEMV